MANDQKKNLIFSTSGAEDTYRFDLPTEPTEWTGKEEGQLAVDVYETETSFVIQATIAGVKPEDIDIDVSGDMITIRGKREEMVEEKNKTYYYKECHWGSFSRSVILPGHFQANNIEATMKNGVLSVTLPKSKPSSTIKVKKVE